MRSVLAGLLILGTLIWLAERYIRWISTHFVLTTDRVIYRSGVIAKHGIEIPLRASTPSSSASASSSGCSAGRPEDRVGQRERAPRFRGHPQPRQGAARIYAQMEANENRGLEKLGDRPPRARRPRAAAPRRRRRRRPRPDQIAELHAAPAGPITDAEFEAKKAELLGRM